MAIFFKNEPCGLQPRVAIQRVMRNFFLSKNCALLSPIVKYKTTLRFPVCDTFGKWEKQCREIKDHMNISLHRSLKVICEAVDKLSGGQ